LNSVKFMGVVAVGMLLIVLVSLAVNKLLPGHAGGHVLIYLVTIGAVAGVIHIGLMFSRECQHEARQIVKAAMANREAMSAQDFGSAFAQDDVALALRVRELLSDYLGIPHDRLRPTDTMQRDLMLGSLDPQLTCHVLSKLYPGWVGRWADAEVLGKHVNPRDMSLKDWVMQLKAWQPEREETDEIARLWVDRREGRT